jgi:hypothetical protein
MFTTPSNHIERNRGRPASLNQVASTNDFRGGEEAAASPWEHMNFILVNGRTPRPQSLCVMCAQPIGPSYLREIGTHLIYCDHDCYADHCQSAILLLQNQTRAS